MIAAMAMMVVLMGASAYDAPATGIGPIYSGFTNRDIATGQDLYRSDYERGKMTAIGMVQAGAIGFGVAARLTRPPAPAVSQTQHFLSARRATQLPRSSSVQARLPGRTASIGTPGRALGEVRYVAGQSVRALEAGVDVRTPPGTKGIRNMMSQLTAKTGREVALLRMKGGTRILRMGEKGFVRIGMDARRVIAHTHPSGRLAFSGADYRALQRLGQHSSVVIDPHADIAARIQSLLPK